MLKSAVSPAFQLSTPWLLLSTSCEDQPSGCIMTLCIVQSALKPIIRLRGGEGNGTDLMLPASLTEDRRALLANSPLEKSPYAPGSHQIHLSLNGQQFTPVNVSMRGHGHGVSHAWALPMYIAACLPRHLA